MIHYVSQTDSDSVFYKEALEEAKLGLSEGGIPIGAVLVCDGKIIGDGFAGTQHGRASGLCQSGILRNDW